MINATIPSLLSFFIPGLGQALLGDTRKGLIFFAIALVLVLIASFLFKSWIMMIVDAIYSIYVAYDAYNMAQNRF